MYKKKHKKNPVNLCLTPAKKNLPIKSNCNCEAWSSIVQIIQEMIAKLLKINDCNELKFI